MTAPLASGNSSAFITPSKTSNSQKKGPQSQLETLPEDLFTKRVFQYLGGTHPVDQFIGLHHLRQTNKNFGDMVTQYLGGKEAYTKQLNVFNLSKQLWDAAPAPLRLQFPWSIIPSRHGPELLTETLNLPTGTEREQRLKCQTIIRFAKNLPRLNEVQRGQLLAAAQSIPDELDRSLALVEGLGTKLECFSEAQRGQLLDAALSTPDEELKAYNLINLARELERFSETQRGQMLDTALNLSTEEPKAASLALLATKLECFSEAQRDQLFGALISAETDEALLLRLSLNPYYSLVLLSEEMQSVYTTITPSKGIDLNMLSQTQREQLLRKILSIREQVTRESALASLVEVVSHLAP